MEHDPSPRRDAATAAAARHAARRPIALDDAGWRAFKLALGEWLPVRASSDAEDRRFVDAALSVMTGHCYWTDLPPQEYGHWVSNYRRNRRWMARGVWAQAVRSGALPEAWAQRIEQYAQRQELERLRRKSRKRERLLWQE